MRASCWPTVASLKTQPKILTFSNRVPTLKTLNVKVMAVSSFKILPQGTLLACSNFNGDFCMTNLRQSIVKRINQRLHKSIALVQHEGNSFLLDTDNRLDMKLMGGMNWERGLRDRAVKVIKDNKLDVFIDAGANLGLYTIDLNHRCELKNTIAFEPLPKNFNQICGNIFANHLSDRVTAKCEALSDADGTAVLRVNTTYTIHSTLQSDNHDPERFDKMVDVPLVRFDNHHKIEDQRVFVKMDVEGHEPLALKGMSDFLIKNKACLQIESFGENINTISKLLASLGYTAQGHIENDYFFSNL